MDEATGKRGPQVGPAADGGPGQRSPEEIRHDIDRTRGELGDTVEALAEKTDVKAQAKQRFDDIRQTAQQKGEEFVGKAKASTPDSATARAQQLADWAEENPVAVAIGAALVVGYLLGRRRGRSRR